jgi:hypothetical protein
VFSGGDVRIPARAGRRQRGRREVRLHEGRQAVPDEGSEAACLNDNDAGKPEGIHPDDRPAVRMPRSGNSTATSQMLEYTKAGDGRAARDARAARRRDSRIRLRPRTGACARRKSADSRKALYDDAKKKRLDRSVSMKSDWKRIFAFDP